MRAGGVYPVSLGDVLVADRTHNLNINNWSKTVNNLVNNFNDNTNISATRPLTNCFELLFMQIIKSGASGG